MPLNIRNYDAILALDAEQQLRSNTGTGWISGGDASIADTSGSIAIDITSVDGRVNNTLLSDSQTTVTLSENSSIYPRRDLIYLSENGTVEKIEGDVEPTDGDIDTDDPAQVRKSDSPAPPDMLGTAGFPIATVFVPVGATESADIDPAHLRDRRLRPWAGHLLEPNADETISGAWTFANDLVCVGDLSLDAGGARINTSGSGSDTIGFYDVANSQDILTANEGGGVEIPNGDLVQRGGNLELGAGGDITSDIDVTSGPDGEQFRFGIYDIGLNAPSIQWRRQADLGYSFEVLNPGTSTSLFNVHDDGYVEFPNGDVSLGGNSLTNLRSSSTALTAGDLSNGEVAMDEANGRLTWKDDSGSAYYVDGTPL